MHSPQRKVRSDLAILVEAVATHEVVTGGVALMHFRECHCVSMAPLSEQCCCSRQYSVKRLVGDIEGCGVTSSYLNCHGMETQNGVAVFVFDARKVGDGKQLA